MKDSTTEILEEEAKRLGIDARVGETVEIEVTHRILEELLLKQLNR